MRWALVALVGAGFAASVTMAVVAAADVLPLAPGTDPARRGGGLRAASAALAMVVVLAVAGPGMLAARAWAGRAAGETRGRALIQGAILAGSVSAACFVVTVLGWELTTGGGIAVQLAAAVVTVLATAAPAAAILRHGLRAVRRNGALRPTRGEATAFATGAGLVLLVGFTGMGGLLAPL